MQSGLKNRTLLGAHLGFDGPVFAWFESLDSFFPFTDQAQGYRLHAPGGQSVADLLPQKRRQIETDQVVEHRAGLLGVDQFTGNMPGVCDGFLDGVFGYFVKCNPFDRRGFGIFGDFQCFQ